MGFGWNEIGLVFGIGAPAPLSAGVHEDVNWGGALAQRRTHAIILKGWSQSHELYNRSWVGNPWYINNIFPAREPPALLLKQ